VEIFFKYIEKLSEKNVIHSVYTWTAKSNYFFQDYKLSGKYQYLKNKG
jgi:hypothetical protein